MASAFGSRFLAMRHRSCGRTASLFIAIRANLFADAETVSATASRELDRIRASRRASPGDPVILPGDPEAAAQAIAATRGVDVTAQTRESLAAIARRLGVDPGPLALPS